jgi:hypothetical protein
VKSKMVKDKKTKTSITKTPKKKFYKVDGDKRLVRVRKSRGKVKIKVVSDRR